MRAIRLLLSAALVATMTSLSVITTAVPASATSASNGFGWGQNAEGRLGNGSTSNTATQVSVSGGLTFVQISAGYNHSCGLVADGTAYCWGSNWYGQLGLGSTTAGSTVPVAVTGGLHFTEISAGKNYTCAVATDHTGYCWGVNDHGQLGDNSTTTRKAPTAVSGSVAFDHIATLGVGNDYAFTCGISTLDAGYCWGYNGYGQLGDGSNTDSRVPVAVAAPTRGGSALALADMSVGGNHVCAVTTTGVGYCWGGNQFGARGDGTTASAYRPTAVSPPSGGAALTFTHIGAGVWFSCGLTTSDAAYCWGNGENGKLGIGYVCRTCTNQYVPTAVGGGHSFSRLSVGGDHVCAVTSAGEAWCWGYSYYGQLGNGTTGSFTATSLPDRSVSTLTVTAISAGAFHTMALASLGPLASASTSSLSFGTESVGATTASQTVTITSAGDADLVVGAATLTGTDASDFTMDTDTCSGQTLTPSSTCTITVSFTPSGTGAKSASLSVPSNDASSPISITLSGTGALLPRASTSPSSLAFGSQLIGTTSSTQAVTVTSSGSDTLVLGAGAVTVTGADASDFAIDTDGCSLQSLAPAGSCSITVTFAPGTSGAKSATLSIASNDAASPTTVAMTGTGTVPTPSASASTATIAFGSQGVGSTSSIRSVTITSSGTADLVLGSGSVSITGSDNADFTVDAEDCSSQTLTTGATCTIDVTFTPSAGGSRTAALEVASNDPSTPTVIALTGTGTTAATLTPAVTSLSFGTIDAGVTSSVQTVTLTSTGTASVVIGTVTLSGSDASVFTIASDTCSGQTIAVSSTCAIGITLTPLHTEAISATILVPSDDPTSPLAIAMTAGTAPDVEAPPARFTFTFSTPGGPSCVPSTRVTQGEVVTLPSIPTGCLTPGSTFLGWTIPRGTASFAERAQVVASADQVFTAEVLLPTIRVLYDSNVALADMCVGSQRAADTKRVQEIDAPRDAGLTLAADAPCVPPGHRLVGWTDMSTPAGGPQRDRGAHVYSPDDVIAIATTPLATRHALHLYAMWVAVDQDA